MSLRDYKILGDRIYESLLRKRNSCSLRGLEVDLEELRKHEFQVMDGRLWWTNFRTDGW